MSLRYKWRLPKTRLFSGMLSLAGGALVAKSLGLAAMPFITRIYTPEEFGSLSIFTSFVLVIAPLISLRYVNAINVPRSEVVAFNIMVLSCVLILLIGVVCSGVIWLTKHQIDGLFRNADLSKHWLLLSITIIGAALYEAFSIWATRNRDYKVMARVQLKQALYGNAAKLGFGMIGWSTLGLIIGQWLQQSSGLPSYYSKYRSDFEKYKSRLSLRRFRYCLIRYASFPRYRLPSHIMMLLSLQAPILFFGYQYDSSVAGQLGLAMMALSLPTQVVGTAMSSAYLGEITKASSDIKILRKTTFSMLKFMVLISLLPVMVLVGFGEQLFVILFGSDWASAGCYAQILAAYLMVKFVSTPLMHLFTVLNRQEMFFKLNLARSIMLVGIGVWIYFDDLVPALALAIFSGFMFFYYLYTCVFSLRLLK